MMDFPVPSVVRHHLVFFFVNLDQNEACHSYRVWICILQIVLSLRTMERVYSPTKL